MKTIYIDKDYKCHVTDDGTMRAVEIEIFDNKCDAYIEGHRFVPHGESWTREDGVIFNGLMVAPWRNYNELSIVQKQYELDQTELEETRSKLEEVEAAYKFLMTGGTA